MPRPANKPGRRKKELPEAGTAVSDFVSALRRLRERDGNPAYRRTAASELYAAAGSVYGDPWQGDTRESYQDFESKLRSGLTGIQSKGDAVAKVLGARSRP